MYIEIDGKPYEVPDDAIGLANKNSSLYVEIDTALFPMDELRTIAIKIGSAEDFPEDTEIIDLDDELIDRFENEELEDLENFEPIDWENFDFDKIPTEEEYGKAEICDEEDELIDMDYSIRSVPNGSEKSHNETKDEIKVADETVVEEDKPKKKGKKKSSKDKNAAEGKEKYARRGGKVVEQIPSPTCAGDIAPTMMATGYGTIEYKNMYSNGHFPKMGIVEVWEENGDEVVPETEEMVDPNTKKKKILVQTDINTAKSIQETFGIKSKDDDAPQYEKMSLF